ncbi:MAG: antitoxin [Acidimicrobiales bacterium]|nr:antitoxin [Acidimicrobiales bacterium]
MGLFDKLKKNAGKAKDLAEQNADKIADGVDKATDAIDKKTKGKFSDHLDKVDGAAEDFADKAGKGDTPNGGRTE